MKEVKQEREMKRLLELLTETDMVNDTLVELIIDEVFEKIDKELEEVKGEWKWNLSKI